MMLIKFDEISELLTFFTEGKLAVMRLIIIISYASDDVTTYQRVTSITPHCDWGIVGHWKPGCRS